MGSFERMRSISVRGGARVITSSVLVRVWGKVLVNTWVSRWMDKAASFHQSIFRTICSLSWLCLLLQCAFVSADSASSSTDLPRLVTYRPGDVDRSTHNGVFVLSCK